MSPFLLGTLGASAYQVICEAGHGSTLGKQLLRIVVLSDGLAPCGWLPAFKRELAYFVDALFFGIVAASRMSGSDRRQRIGDSWARTVVVRRRTAPTASLRSGMRLVVVCSAGLLADAFICAVPSVLRAFAA